MKRPTMVAHDQTPGTVVPFVTMSKYTIWIPACFLFTSHNLVDKHGCCVARATARLCDLFDRGSLRLWGHCDGLLGVRLRCGRLRLKSRPSHTSDLKNGTLEAILPHRYVGRSGVC